jgi:hypothetical protein
MAMRAAAVLRGVLGATTLVGGLTWVLLNLHGPRPATDVPAGLVLAAGGLVLLMPHRITLPPFWGLAGPVAAALAGTAGGLASVLARACCAFVFAEARGWPFRWLQRGAVAGDPETARNLGRAARWQVDVPAAAGDLLVWAYAGLLVVVVAVLVRRAAADRAPVG